MGKFQAGQPRLPGKGGQPGQRHAALCLQRLFSQPGNAAQSVAGFKHKGPNARVVHQQVGAVAHIKRGDALLQRGEDGRLSLPRGAGQGH
ncbi:hypothetical protein SDC9_154054 [bioreactor metagenome]|uniref:Uncharacterized protein n=1 Tax=bioreactor metagenome TaxID=1076179 RepID=A0A645EY01_9ZZZZ